MTREFGFFTLIVGDGTCKEWSHDLGLAAHGRLLIGGDMLLVLILVFFLSQSMNALAEEVDYSGLNQGSEEQTISTTEEFASFCESELPKLQDPEVDEKEKQSIVHTVCSVEHWQVVGSTSNPFDYDSYSGIDGLDGNRYKVYRFIDLPEFLSVKQQVIEYAEASGDDFVLQKLKYDKIKPTEALVEIEDKEELAKLTLLPGDILIQRKKVKKVWEPMFVTNILSDVVTRSVFVHAALYIGKKDGKHRIIEAIGGGVKENDLQIYVDGQSSFLLIRPPFKGIEERQRAVAFAREKAALSALGYDYDYLFGKSFLLTIVGGPWAQLLYQRMGGTDSQRYYCTELVFGALVKGGLRSNLGKEPVFIGSDIFIEMDGSRVFASYRVDEKMWTKISKRQS